MRDEVRPSPMHFHLPPTEIFVYENSPPATNATSTPSSSTSPPPCDTSAPTPAHGNLSNSHPSSNSTTPYCRVSRTPKRFTFDGVVTPVPSTQADDREEQAGRGELSSSSPSRRDDGDSSLALYAADDEDAKKKSGTISSTNSTGEAAANHGREGTALLLIAEEEEEEKMNDLNTSGIGSTVASDDEEESQPGKIVMTPHQPSDTKHGDDSTKARVCPEVLHQKKQVMLVNVAHQQQLDKRDDPRSPTVNDGVECRDGAPLDEEIGTLVVERSQKKEEALQQTQKQKSGSTVQQQQKDSQKEDGDNVSVDSRVSELTGEGDRSKFGSPKVQFENKRKIDHETLEVSLFDEVVEAPSDEFENRSPRKINNSLLALNGLIDCQNLDFFQCC